MTGSLYRRGRVWWMVFRADGRRHQISTKTTNKTLAQRILNKVIADVLEGRFKLTKSNPPTLAEWGKQFLESIPNPATKRTYSSCLNTLNEFFGSASLSDITTERIEVFKVARAKAGAGPAIVNRNLALLRHLMKLALRRRLVSLVFSMRGVREGWRNPSLTSVSPKRPQAGEQFP